MTSGERYKIFKEWFDSIGFPEMHSSYKDAMWHGFEAGYCKASKVNAAAPELLEALQRCESVLSNIPLEVCDVEDLLYARAAINKALGE